jgi:hypothetical protein
MKTITKLDCHNKGQITVEITGPSYNQRIAGAGYFIIINPQSEHVSFSKSNHDTCVDNLTADIIPGYTNQQFADEYGNEFVAELGITVKEYMSRNLRMIVS